MSQIKISHLTFAYEASAQNIFEDVSFVLDTDWKLGFTGRNGRGKTTFLKLLMGEHEYAGSIEAAVEFCYFPDETAHPEWETMRVLKACIAPFEQWEREMEACIGEGEEGLERYGVLQELYESHDGYIIEELIERESGKLQVDPSALRRSYATLSNGERTKLLIGALLLRKNNFLLIDEPTNHLDMQGRRILAQYLRGKKGFLLVSHDRMLLDSVTDHTLSINRTNIEVQKGGYSLWRAGKEERDALERQQNKELRRDIARLNAARGRTANWAEKVEKSKWGDDAADKGYIGHKAAKMMQRAKNMERRMDGALEEKARLLKNVEESEPLKIHPLKFPKRRLAEARGLGVCYDGRPVFEDISFVVEAGDRVALRGPNGCGKSSVLKLLAGHTLEHSGTLLLPQGLIVSYVPQDASFLQGGMRDWIRACGVDETLFKAILRKLDFSRAHFEQELSELSAGQKKKVLIAKSLAQQAHLYLWDEPLNYVDVDSRLQIEELLLRYAPPMVFVEHDEVFCQKIANRMVFVGK